jgi:hypothetical protein
MYKALIKKGHHPTSLCLPHIASGTSKHFNVYLLTYWKEQAEIRHVKQKAIKSYEMLEERMNNLKLSLTSRDLAQTAITLLGTLPWQGKVKGFSDDGDIIDLFDFLSKRWLKSGHQNMMLDILRRELTLGGFCSTLIPQNMVTFVSKMTLAYQEKDRYIGGEIRGMNG